MNMVTLHCPLSQEATWNFCLSTTKVFQHCKQITFELQGFTKQVRYYFFLTYM